MMKLQQHLPLAVLKRLTYTEAYKRWFKVATAPTACGIETRKRN